MHKKTVIALLMATGAAVVALFGATITGYVDVQQRSTPGNPPSGYLRWWATSGSVKCLQSSGAACLFDSASGATFKTNGTTNGSQSTLNLAAGSNMTLTDNGSGTVTFDSSGTPVTFKTNGTTNGSQTTLNLAAGSNMTLTDNGSGTITLAASGGTLTLKTNGSTNGSQSTLNLAAGSNMTLVDNGTGTVTITAAVSHVIGMAFGQSGGANLATGSTFISMPFACTIGSTWYTYSDQTVTFDLKRSGTSLVSGGAPSAAAGSNSGSTSGWTTSISAGDVLEWKLLSVSGSPTTASITLGCN